MYSDIIDTAYMPQTFTQTSGFTSLSGLVGAISVSLLLNSAGSSIVYQLVLSICSEYNNPSGRFLLIANEVNLM